MNAPQVAVSLAPVLNTNSHRFDLPDLDRCGLWLMPRLKQAYPHLNDRGIISWIRNIVFVNDFLFVCQDNAVALAQCISAHTLNPKPVIQEHFVWVQDRDNQQQIAAAACFYEDFGRWAKHHGAEVITVEENSDVPHELIGKKLGRIFTRQQQFARVKE